MFFRRQKRVQVTASSHLGKRPMEIYENSSPEEFLLWSAVTSKQHRKHAYCKHIGQFKHKPKLHTARHM